MGSVENKKKPVETLCIYIYSMLGNHNISENSHWRKVMVNGSHDLWRTCATLMRLLPNSSIRCMELGRWWQTGSAGSPPSFIYYLSLSLNSNFYFKYGLPFHIRRERERFDLTLDRGRIFPKQERNFSWKMSGGSSVFRESAKLKGDNESISWSMSRYSHLIRRFIRINLFCPSIDRKLP